MNIKLLLASALTVLLTVSCTSTNGTKQSTSNDGDATEQNLKTNNNNMAKTINLTREQFLAKVLPMKFC